jgi:hypothetical protein
MSTQDVPQPENERNRIAEVSGAVRNTLTFVLLSRFEYCHVRDKNTGALTLHDGPKRLSLASHEELDDDVRSKIRVHDGQYCIVLNPHSSDTNDILEGEREVRIGPCVFSLFPGERLEGSVQHEEVLTDDDALLLRAEKNAPHPLAGVGAIANDAILSSGEETLLTGPTRFIPHKDIRIKERRQSVSLSETEGVYVQNDDTGEVRLVQGPDDFFLGANESFWDKDLTREELQSLGHIHQETVAGERVLAAEPRSRIADHDAVVIDLEDNEAICLYDGDRVLVEFGPKTIFLGPYARPKVQFLSGGIPVRPSVLRVAKLKLGPDFIRDTLVVRTRDNATLTVDVNYRWRFLVDEAQPERLFALKDFVGFAAQTMSSEIREVAAAQTFEAFHARAAQLVKEAIFEDEATRVFQENGLEIFGVDVEAIAPEDPEIKQKLADAIKTNVDIYTRRVQEEAELENARILIEGRAKNEEARKKLITLEDENARTQLLASVQREREATLVQVSSEAEAIRVRSEAKREAEESRLRAVTSVLSTPGAAAFIELERARALRATDKVIVPTDSKLVLGNLVDLD